jgi:hypothetical protein
VYGIVPAEVELTGDVRGVGDPPGRIQLVRHGNLAALVSEVDRIRGLGTPQDLQAHAQVLDTTVVEVPVLPLRFGTVMATKDAVAWELLAVYQESFAAALREVEGRAQYVVKGRYVEQAVLAEALAELPETRHGTGRHERPGSAAYPALQRQSDVAAVPQLSSQERETPHSEQA